MISISYINNGAETGSRPGSTRIKLALILTYFVFAILLNSVGIVILQSINSFGVTKSEAAVLEAFKDLPIAAVSLLIASVLYRVGFRNAAATATLCVAAAAVAMPLLPGFWSIKILFLIVGSSFAIVKISTYTLIGLLTDDAKHHAALTNTIEGIFMIGVLAGYWIFSAFIDADDGSSLAWLNVYWLLAVLCLAVAALLAASKVDETDVRRPPGDGTSFAQMLGLLGRVFVLMFLTCAFLYVLIEQALGTWLPTFNSEVLNLPAFLSVQTASLYAVALAIGRLSAGFFIVRFGWYRPLMLCVTMAAALIGVSLSMANTIQGGPIDGWHDVPALALVLPMVGLFLAPVYPTLISTVLSALSRPRHAPMTGLIVVFSALGGTAGSYVTGRLFEHFGGQTAFLITLAPCAALLVGIWLFKEAISTNSQEGNVTP